MVIEHLYIGDHNAASDNRRLHSLGVTLIIQVVVGVALKFPQEFHYHLVEIIDDPKQELIK